MPISNNYRQTALNSCKPVELELYIHVLNEYVQKSKLNVYVQNTQHNYKDHSYP